MNGPVGHDHEAASYSVVDIEQLLVRHESAVNLTKVVLPAENCRLPPLATASIMFSR